MKNPNLFFAEEESSLGIIITYLVFALFIFVLFVGLNLFIN